MKLRALLLKFFQRARQFVQPVLGQIFSVEMRKKKERDAVFEYDLRFCAVDLRDDHGKAARTDIDDGIFHKILLRYEIFCASPKRMPMLFAKRTSSPSGSTSL